MLSIPVDFLPVLLALCSAFLFAVGSQLQNLGLAGGTHGRTGAALSITTAAGCYWLMAPVYLDPSNFWHSATLIFILVGIFRPSLSANLSVAGIKFLGPTLSSTMASTTPVFGAILGITILGEVFTWQLALGTAGIIGAVLLLTTGKINLKDDWPLWALLLPVGAALIRALAHVLSKIGMEDLPDPYFVGLVGFTVSALITLGSLKIKAPDAPIPWENRSPIWFMVAGISFATAIFSLNHALLVGEITVVVPIIATSPIFSILLSILVFKRETFTIRNLLAILIVSSAVALIGASR